MFSKAIIRQPSDNFADGLTSVDLGVPDLETAVPRLSPGNAQDLIR